MILSSEYDNETEVQYGNNKFSIYRTYERDNGYTELYLSERVGVV